MTLKEIAQSVLAEDAAVSPATAELSAGNIDLAAHDRRFHPHGYDPKRDSCSLRADLDKGDNPDAAVGSAPSPQGDGWNPAERAEAERAAAALRRILGGLTVTFSDKPYVAGDDTESRFSRQTLPNGRAYVLVDIDQHLFDGKSEIEQKKLATQIIRERFVNKVIGEGGAKSFVPDKAAKEFSRPASRKVHGELSNAKMRTSPELDTMLSSAVYKGHEPDDGGHPEAEGGWDYYDVIFKVGNKFYRGDVNILVDAKNRFRFQDITHIHEETLSQLLQSTQGHSASTSTPTHEVLQGQTPAEGSSDAIIVPNSSAERNGGSEDSLIRSDTGKVVGEYDRSTGKITLYPGAKTADVVHEFSHGLWQFAEEEAAAGRRSLLDKMHEIAVSAPKSVKDAVAADYPDASDSVYLEECFTHEMSRRSDTAFAKAVASDEGKPWYRKAWGAIKSIWNGYASKHGADKADIDKAASLPPAEAADFILGEMARGRKFGTVSHSGKNGGKRKSIIGERGAAALGIGKLDEAQKMSKDGASREDIWRKTGWWRGKDGKWRVEIPDIRIKNGQGYKDKLYALYGEYRAASDAHYKASQDYQGAERVYKDFQHRHPVKNRTDDERAQSKALAKERTKLWDKMIDARHHQFDAEQNFRQAQKFGTSPIPLGDMVDAPALFEAYPKLRDVQVQYTTRLPKGTLGNLDDNRIDIDSTLGAKEAQSVLSHEIQHAIQDSEGFAGGGNLSQFSYVEPNSMTPGRACLNVLNLTTRDAVKSVEYSSDSPIAKGVVELKEKASDGDDDAQTHLEAIREIANGLGYKDLDAFIKDAHYELLNLTPYGQYRRLVGETESRNVEKRLAMTPEERAATPPWETEDVPEDRQIVRDSAPAFDPRAFARYLAQN